MDPDKAKIQKMLEVEQRISDSIINLLNVELQRLHEPGADLSRGGMPLLIGQMMALTVTLETEMVEVAPKSVRDVRDTVDLCVREYIHAVVSEEWLLEQSRPSWRILYYS